MTYTQLLSDWEASFKATGYNGQFQLNPFSVSIKGEELRLYATACRPKKNVQGIPYRGYFEKENCAHLKKHIVLHFTAGHLRGDISTLALPKKKAGGTYKTRHRISVPFVIARDGTIYNLFSSKYWSYHLGKGTVISGLTKKTIGIELSNVGYLVKKGNNLLTYYGKVYCTLADTQHYTKIDTPYRKKQYYAKFTDAQYKSLIILLRYLTAQYNIPRTFIDEAERYKASVANATIHGISSHVNHRSSGKWDIGPAFDWDMVIAGVTADTYGEITEVRVTRSDVSFESEDDLELGTDPTSELESIIRHNVAEHEDEDGELDYDPSDFE